MNKKGFTLVELLAVIAILAVLIIVALPNMINLFNEAKKNSFENEVKNIYKTAEEQWITDSVYSQNEISYSRCADESCNNSLKLTGREGIEYYIKFNAGGKVIVFIVSDGTYQYSYGGDGLKIENITGVVELSSSTGKIEISGSGAKNIATFVTRHDEASITPCDELTIAGDNFYVISSDWQETVLISKYDLNATTNEQVTSGTVDDITKFRFSEVGYWDGCMYSVANNSLCTSSPEGLLSPYSDNGKAYCSTNSGTNCAYVYDSNSNFYGPVNAYTNKIASLSGAYMTGRLLMVEEYRSTLVRGTECAKTIKDPNQFAYNTGSAFGKYKIFRVEKSGNSIAYAIDGAYAIRPVLVVSTDAL